MKHLPDNKAGWAAAIVSGGLPAPLDCETRAMLRLFLAPILECARSWTDLSETLSAKGYDIAFREGHLVILNDQGAALCTGRDMGVPLAEIAARIGRPCVRAHRGGQSGHLRRIG